MKLFWSNCQVSHKNTEASATRALLPSVCVCVCVCVRVRASAEGLHYVGVCTVMFITSVSEQALHEASQQLLWACFNANKNLKQVYLLSSQSRC